MSILKEMLKNKNNRIALGVILVVILGLVGFYFFSGSSKPKADDKQSVEATVQTLSPEEIGLKLEATSDKKKVKFSIAKASDIQSIEYQLTYDADSTAQEKSEGGEDRVQRGITGEASIKAGQSSFKSDDLDLGSCSKNVCRYDTGVSKVDITLKITKSNGKVYDVTDSLSL